MVMTMKAANESTVSAAVFKARCLALLDRVARTGRTVVVTKRGRPVARVVPVDQGAPSDLRGSILHQDDIVSPLAVDWAADR